MRVDRPFVGVPSFLRSSVCTDLEQLNADIAVMGVPTDEGSPFMPGSRFGPRSIREQSLRFGRSGYFDPQEKRQFLELEMTDGRVVDVGDVDILPTNVVGTFQNITAMTRKIIERSAMVVVLGGDHAITFPVVRAFNEPIQVVQLDAHLDYAPFVHGLEWTNGQAFRHISQLPHVRGLIQVGIRSLRNTRQMFEDSIRDGNRVVTIEEFRNLSPRGLTDSLPANLRCYVSIDIDVLDLSLVPGCVSGEPDGMSHSELRATLRMLAERLDIVGFDLVEVNPQLDVGTGATSYLAAHTIVEFLGRICDQPRWTARQAIRIAEVKKK